MRRARFLLCAVAMAAGLVGCGGGGKKGTADPEPASAEAVDDSAALKVEGTCRTLCKRVAGFCESDPLSEFDVDACQEACVDETDGVLQDVGNCLDEAESCSEAADCRADFGD